VSHLPRISAYPHIYIQDYKRSLQESLGYSQKTLNELEEIVIKFDKWLKKAKADKELLNQEIDVSSKNFRNSLIKKYDSFGQELLSMIDKIFGNIPINKEGNLLEYLKSSINLVPGLIQIILSFLSNDKSLQ
jgi:hypothetical protein